MAKIPKITQIYGTFPLLNLRRLGFFQGVSTIAAIPHIARYSQREFSSPPKWCDTPPFKLSFPQAHLCDTPFFRKILAPIKIKSALPPPPPQTPPPSKTRNFMDMGFPAERTHFFQVSIKLAQPFPAPELRTRILRTRGLF